MSITHYARNITLAGLTGIMALTTTSSRQHSQVLQVPMRELMPPSVQLCLAEENHPDECVFKALSRRQDRKSSFEMARKYCDGELPYTITYRGSVDAIISCTEQEEKEYDRCHETKGCEQEKYPEERYPRYNLIL